jgi:hypothetical protein
MTSLRQKDVRDLIDALAKEIVCKGTKQHAQQGSHMLSVLLDL